VFRFIYELLEGTEEILRKREEELKEKEGE